MTKGHKVVLAILFIFAAGALAQAALFWLAAASGLTAAGFTINLIESKS